MTIDTGAVSSLVTTATEDVVAAAATYQADVLQVVAVALAKAAELTAIGDPRGPIVTAAATLAQSQVVSYPPTAAVAAAVAASVFA